MAKKPTPLNTSGPVIVRSKTNGSRKPGWKTVAGSVPEAKLESGKITERLTP